MVFNNLLPVLFGLFLFTPIFLVFLPFYIYFCIALMMIAKKTNTPNSWLAFIPFANMHLMTKIAEVDWWWTATAFLGIILLFLENNFYLGLGVLAVVTVVWWWKIMPQLGRPKGEAILMIIPIINLIELGLVTWGSGPVSKLAHSKKKRR